MAEMLREGCEREEERRSVKRVSSESVSPRWAGVGVGLVLATRDGAGVAGAGVGVAAARAILAVASALLDFGAVGAGAGVAVAAAMAVVFFDFESDAFSLLGAGGGVVVCATFELPSALELFGPCAAGAGVVLGEFSATLVFFAFESVDFSLPGAGVVAGAWATFELASALEDFGPCATGAGAALVERSATLVFFAFGSADFSLAGTGVVEGAWAMVFCTGAGELFATTGSVGRNSPGRRLSVRESENFFGATGAGLALPSAALPTCARSHSKRLVRSSLEAPSPVAMVCPSAQAKGTSIAAARRE